MEKPKEAKIGMLIGLGEHNIFRQVGDYDEYVLTKNK